MAVSPPRMWEAHGVDLADSSPPPHPLTRFKAKPSDATMIPRSPGLPMLVLVVAFASGCLAHTQDIPGPDARPFPTSAASLGEPMEYDPEGQRTERVVLPFLLYSPETKLGGGLVAAGYRRLQPGLPTSSVLGAVTVTSQRQLSLDFFSEIHQPGGGRLDGSLGFQHFPDQFYGVGPGTPDEAEEKYTSRIFHAGLRGQRRVHPGLQVGPKVTFRWEDVVETEEEGRLASDALIAPEGGRWLGLGAAATHDTRDHVVNPRQGTYLELSTTAFPEALGTTGYRSAFLDGRRFLPLGTASTVAFRVHLESAGGDVPVLLLPSLGGRERLRGYYEGRVRDRVAGVAQGEVRFPLWWRFGGAAFAEAGQVGPGLRDLASGRTELSMGAGLRFRLGEESAPIRLDFAVGRRGSGLYLTIGEAF